MKVRPFFIAHAQSPELIEPRERPLNNPAPSQSTTMFCVALRKKSDDAFCYADLAGSLQHRNHGHPTRIQDDGEGVRTFPARQGSHQPVPGPAVSRFG